MARHDFGHVPIRDSGEPLVLIERAEFLQEPKYFEWGIATTPAMHLRSGTLDRLRKAQRNLPKGYRLKLWDCFRPLAVQYKLFEQCTATVTRAHPTWTPEQILAEARKFIAIPDRPGEVPPHNSGGTVDLTVVNEGGDELNMGTEFDEFGEECHPLYFEEIVSKSPEDIIIARNRNVLFEAMRDAGFRRDTDEWWHFDYGNQLWALEFGEPFAIYGSAESLPAS